MRTFSKGDRVSHSHYGPGTLAEIDEQYAVIDFDQEGTRKFVTRLLVLESTDAPAPVRVKPARRKAAAKPPA